MIGINKGPIVSDLETIFIRFDASPIPSAIGRGEMIAAIIQNPFLNPDGSPNPLGILVGSGSNQIYYMIPGQESPIIYAEDQKDIYIKVFAPTLVGGIAALRSFPVDAGTGYTVGDEVTLTGADSGSNDAVITVTQAPGGVIFDYDITNPGTGYIVGETVTGSGGTGVDYENIVFEILGAVQIPIFIYRRRKGGKQ